MSAKTLGDRVIERRKKLGLTQKDLAERSGLSQPVVSSLERNVAKDTRRVGTLASALECNAAWLQTGLGREDAGVRGVVMQRSAQVSDGEGGSLEFELAVIDSRGSCGGGVSGQRDIDEIIRTMPPIIKDQAFFDSLGVNASDVVAIVADGSALANYIVHGDTVLIHTAQSDQIDSGVIYAIKTPSGIRLKRLLERADGSIVLTCDNHDKDRYPNEEYTAKEAAQLMMIGRFLYRQG